MRPRGGSLFRVVAAALMTIAASGCGAREDRAPDRRDTTGTLPAARATEESAPAPSAPRIVVLGDSLTAGLGIDVAQAYPAVLQRRVKERGLDYQIVNAGVSGDTSAGGLARLDWALDGDVRMLVLALGANDGLRGLPVEELKRNLAQIIERVQARHITVVLAGMEAPPNFGPQYTAGFRDVYPALARQYHVKLVPFLLDGVAADDALNQRDGIHPNSRGAQIVADNIWSVLGPMLDGQARRD